MLPFMETDLSIIFAQQKLISNQEGSVDYLEATGLL